jgi:hypothetical protein
MRNTAHRSGQFTRRQPIYYSALAPSATALTNLIFAGRIRALPPPGMTDQVGVRPSPGAAISASVPVPEQFNAPDGSRLAAPEDGRTPGAVCGCALFAPNKPLSIAGAPVCKPA